VITRARARDRLPLFLVAVLWLAVLPAAANGASAPRVVAASHVPLVAAAGDRIAVTAKVAGTGKRVVLGLVLGSPQGSATGGLALGKGVTFSRRGARRVVVRGRVPATVALGELHTLLVCVDPAGAIRGKGSCRAAAKIATSGTSTEERLAGARQAGRLSKAKAVLFGLLALRGDKRVPAELKGGLGGPSGEEAAIMAAANSLPGLPAGVRKQVLAFLVPPRGQGSAWAPAPKKTSHSKRRQASAASAATLDCRGYAKLDRGYFEGNLYPWRGVPTSDGKAIVWYQVNADLKDVEAQDHATALRYAAELPKIWTKLTTEFGAPLSDGNQACFHGPDGRYDVYVDSAVVSIESRFAKGVLALTIPYPANGTGTSCSLRPSWITIRNDLSNWALAHEFMHALQFSHRTADCTGAIAWWTEGSASWAGDFVYPDDNHERQFPRLVAHPLGSELVKLDYDAWPFWMMLQRTQGTGVLRSIFTQLQTQRTIPAVNAAIPGGFADQLPRFFLHAFNQSPIGDAGFAIPQSFLDWDKWSQTPSLPASTSLGLGMLPADTLTLPSQRADGFPALSVGAYHRVNIPDPAVRAITFTNDLSGKPGAHVDALLHMADGSWKLADWTANRTVTLCRDRAGEDVRGLVIVSTNTGTSPLGAFTHTLKVGSTCPFPQRFDGTWTRVYTDPSRGSWTETIHGTATYVRDPSFPPEADTESQVPYDVQTSTVNWTVSGSQDPGTGCLNNFSGSGTDTPTTNHTGTNTDLGLENVSHREGAPDPEPKPYYYSIRAGIDPSTDPEYDVTDCHGNGSKESVVLPYLEIGHPGPFMPNTPPDEIVKSDDDRLLEGHRSVTDPSSGDLIDDTWSFKGSD
jgi:hypothetical protein